MGPKTDRRQQHGEESRQRILDAAVQIAAERGYEGTTMSLVRQRSGMPNSSIYWHFQDKDALFVAVIERSYHLWRERLTAVWSGGGSFASRAEHIHAMARAIAASLLDQPEFLSLGLMLTLERRPVEIRARELFIEIRAEVHALARDEYERALADLPPEQRARLAARLATHALATADGLFLAYQLNPATFDLLAEFDLLATTLNAALDRWLSQP